jgi:hypothetical protein
MSHPARYAARAGDACAGCRKPRVVNRRIFAFLGFAALLSGCKDPQPQGSSNANQFVRGSVDVVVKSVRVYAATQNSVQGDTIYVVAFTFTNNQGLELSPAINHFVFEDEQKVRHAGLEGGSYLLAGISNDLSVMKRGESRDFTVGFSVYQNTTGTLFYDPT